MLPMRPLIDLNIDLGRAKIPLHHLARNQRPPRERQLRQLGSELLERHTSVQDRRHDHVPRRPTRTIEVSDPHATLTASSPHAHKSNRLLLSPTKPQRRSSTLTRNLTRPANRASQARCRSRWPGLGGGARGRGTTRYASACPLRLGSISARMRPLPLGGNGSHAPSPPTPQPRPARRHRTLAMRWLIWLA